MEKYARRGNEEAYSQELLVLFFLGLLSFPSTRYLVAQSVGATSTSAPLFKQVIGIVKEKDGVQVEVALQPTTGYKIIMYSYANAVRTHDGGVHETGFKAALTKVVNDYALKWGMIKSREKDSFKPEVIQQGLNVVISVILTDPQFQGQTKDRLNNAPVEGIVRSVVDEGLKDWFERNINAGKEWLKKILQMQKARNEAQLVEELARAGNKKNGELIDTTLSRKFLRCNSSDPARSELFIVEGDSTGGSAGACIFGAGPSRTRRGASIWLTLPCSRILAPPGCPMW